ncbi:MAG: hypothetical protein DHS80DRAFT_26231 [Piptocephalis tieghemiana]|nr:MAG: hypothetical protein DHS80DRAFT_26231 [Piptocephalis tieghemiana]
MSLFGKTTDAMEVDPTKWGFQTKVDKEEQADLQLKRRLDEYYDKQAELNALVLEHIQCSMEQSDQCNFSHLHTEYQERLEALRTEYADALAWMEMIRKMKSLVATAKDTGVSSFSSSSSSSSSTLSTRPFSSSISSGNEYESGELTKKSGAGSTGPTSSSFMKATSENPFSLISQDEPKITSSPFSPFSKASTPSGSSFASSISAPSSSSFTPTSEPISSSAGPDTITLDDEEEEEEEERKYDYGEEEEKKDDYGEEEERKDDYGEEGEEDVYDAEEDENDKEGHDVEVIEDDEEREKEEEKEEEKEKEEKKEEGDGESSGTGISFRPLRDSSSSKENQVPAKPNPFAFLAYKPLNLQSSFTSGASSAPGLFSTMTKMATEWSGKGPEATVSNPLTGLSSFEKASPSPFLASTTTTSSSSSASVADNAQDEPSDAARDQEISKAENMSGEGEEEEKTLMQLRTKLFTKTKEGWETLGVGIFKVKEKIEGEDQGKRRMLCRTDGGKVILNSRFAPNATVIHTPGQKDIRALAQVGTDGALGMMLIRVKSPGEADELVGVMKESFEASR